jgi:FtsZ-interacting cell division protein ZipA
MSLKLALLLIAVVIVVTVAIGALDQARTRSRRLNRDRPREEAEEDEVLAVAPAEPAGAPAALEKRSLKADRPIPHQMVRQPHEDFYEELKRIERAVDVRLDVDPDIDRRAATAEAEAEPEIPGRVVPTVANERIDFIVTLPGSSPVSRHKALGLFRQNEYLLDKPRAIYGRRHVTKVWTNLETDPEDMEYDELRLTLQMADSDGSVTESELNTYTQMALQFGDQLKRRTLFSLDHEDALLLAQDLDGFCKEYDVIASLNIVANSPTGFGGRAVDGAATEAGMQYGDMRIYHMADGGGRTLFSLANLFKPGDFDREHLDGFHTEGVTLFMQVATVNEPAAVFEQMAEVGAHMAEELGGRLVDQDGKALTDSGRRAIAAQIEQIAGDMSRRGIEPGSEAARRLFGI